MFAGLRAQTTTQSNTSIIVSRRPRSARCLRIGFSAIVSQQQCNAGKTYRCQCSFHSEHREVTPVRFSDYSAHGRLHTQGREEIYPAITE